MDSHWAPEPPWSAALGGAKPAPRQTNGPGRNGVSTQKPVKGGSLTFGIDTEESGFNPSTARWDEGGFLYGRTVFDPIAIVNAAGGVEPYLAESITSNEDFTTFTITLRPDIVFHDGTPLDADALHQNIEATASGVLTGPAFADFSSATVTGPLTVTIDMKEPWAPFPYYLAQAQTGYIAAPSMLNAPDGGTSNPIGTGPFVFQDWVPNSHMTATRNPHYWRKGYPYLELHHLQADHQRRRRAPTRSRPARSTSCTPAPPTTSCSSGATRSTPTTTTAGRSWDSPRCSASC